MSTRRRKARPERSALGSSWVLPARPTRGAGRPRESDAGVSHSTRPSFEPGQPLLVTVRFLPALPSLRKGRAVQVVRRALGAGRDRFGFHLQHAALRDHELLLVVVAEDRPSLARGMKGLKVRLARRLNSHWGRSTAAFADRYDVRPLYGRRTLDYVLTTMFGRDRIVPIDPEDGPGTADASSSEDR